MLKLVIKSDDKDKTGVEYNTDESCREEHIVAMAHLMAVMLLQEEPKSKRKYMRETFKAIKNNVDYMIEEIEGATK